MAFSLESERPSVAAFPAHPVRALVAWMAEARAKHMRRAALSRLLEMEPARLADLGIARHDVIEALRHPERSTGHDLAAKRSRASDDWLLHP